MERGENLIQEISLGKAFPKLLRQTYLPTENTAKQKSLYLLKTMSGKLDFFRFRSEAAPEAIHMAWERVRPII